MKNYYQILNLEQTASGEEIKKAYRLYAFKFHPDKHEGDSFFEERFKEINEANEILSDPIKKAQYDRELESFNSINSYHEPKTHNESNDYNTYEYKREAEDENKRQEQQQDYVKPEKDKYDKTAYSTKQKNEKIKTPIKNFGKALFIFAWTMPIWAFLLIFLFDLSMREFKADIRTPFMSFFSFCFYGGGIIWGIGSKLKI